ncbi:MAG: geranylgeranylglycerol-phosphate geranylgeranyltransferase [Ignavibacteria bacterium]|nr:geranylgeranylglycerol-phosphate geranylgeranyltransferase [Ignavibacteria bacterium]MBT8381379.1 geranylgeranylglycerol-phosphate geranylgeranyltransferase [Ignavibacteria bacterium]MBT8391356.1 geranylgeranylglycerol-phosphate geranylgeranyltransferase [Ignavibacteria bacterium]NNJ53026.1 geranylgeranylglycerol-phosphate geranylgeranyltransferase [Ignavibacteriaceae bacterium]NNL21459.1 geranylgeranylglycerol-phosphate geranylgeranyltransferase [Ignavibacteriaceae bacterium]
MKEKLTAFIFITRPVNFLITILSVIVAAIISSSQNYFELTVFLSAIAAGVTASAGNVINDIFDFEIDKINQPQRPLPAKKISVKQAYILYYTFLLISLLISFFISLPVLLVVLFSHFILFLYSKILKKIPLVGNATVAFLTGFVFIFGGIVVGSPTAAVVPALFAFLINLIRELVKDIQDVNGDRAVGLFTFPIKFGVQKSKILITIFTLTLILFTFYPFITKLYKIEYFVIVMALVNPILIYCAKKMYEKELEKNLKKISNLLKLSMVFGLLAIYLGV